MHSQRKSKTFREMELYNEALTDNAAMIRGASIPTEPPSLEQHTEVAKIRRLLFIFIGIDFVSGLKILGSIRFY